MAAAMTMPVSPLRSEDDEEHVNVVDDEMLDEEKDDDSFDHLGEEDSRFDDGSGGPLCCRLCDKSFRNRGLLNVHYTHTHRDKPQYECDDCGLIFTVKRELATHRRIHTGSPLHTCMQCGKVFGTKQLLKKHYLWHTGQRAHVCPQCGKAFYQKGHLTQHLMIHTGGRPHVCRLCKKTFVFKFDLNRHLKIHAERGHVVQASDFDYPSSDPPTVSFDRKSVDSVGAEGDRDSMQSPSDSLENSGHIPPAPPSPRSVSVDNVIASVTAAVSAADVQAPLVPAYQHHGMSIADWLALRAHYQATLGQQLAAASATSSIFPSHIVAPMTAKLQPGDDYEHDENVATSDSSTTSPNQSEPPMSAGVDGGESLVSPAVHVPKKSDSLNGLDCVQCMDFRHDLVAANQRINELESRLQHRDGELQRLKEKMNRIGSLAGSLLETCSDFDKLWMLHSKKVYNHIQTVLNTLE